jgi:hypothetical protein
VPPLFSILSGEFGFAVVVPDFAQGTRRKAARTLWEAHVSLTNPLASISEFSQLIKAGEEKVFYRYSDTDPERWGERWGEDGDCREEDPLLVLWYLDDDIPGRHTWEEN